jgi:hypothetical protein
MGKMNLTKRSIIKSGSWVLFIVACGSLIGLHLSDMHIDNGLLPVKVGSHVYKKVTSNPVPQPWCAKIHLQPQEVRTGWPFVSSTWRDDTACSRFGSFSYGYAYPMGIVANMLVGSVFMAFIYKCWFSLIRLSRGGFEKNQKHRERNKALAYIAVYSLLAGLILASIFTPGVEPPNGNHYKYSLPALIDVPGKTTEQPRTDVRPSPNDCKDAEYTRPVKFYYGYPIVTRVRTFVMPDNPCFALKYVDTAYPIGVWLNVLVIIALFSRVYRGTERYIEKDIETVAERERIA